MTSYEKVLKTRSGSRPTSLDYIAGIFEGFTEFHGDRSFGDNPAVVGGVALLDGRAVTVIGLEKGHDTDEKIRRNFGSALPEGYRKALRLMRQAEKFKRPVVCLVDTAGASCTVEAEQRGQGQAIAENLAEMSGLKTPIISIILSEGGSGGALALAVADEVWMIRGAYYSVISPEACATIIWKDISKAPEAAECLKLTAENLKKIGVVDRIFDEPEDFSQEKARREVFQSLREALRIRLSYLMSRDVSALLNARYEKFRKIGKA